MFDTVVESPLTALGKSHYTFYLTGSRYFGFARDNSDYDFYVQDSRPVREFLENEGFTTLLPQSHNYKDHNCAVVFRKENVDIQLVYNISYKHAAQKAIKEAGVLMPGREHWEVAYKVIINIYGFGIRK